MLSPETTFNEMQLATATTASLRNLFQDEFIIEESSLDGYVVKNADTISTPDYIASLEPISRRFKVGSFYD
jgi:hypothetical protein